MINQYFRHKAWRSPLAERRAHRGNAQRKTEKVEIPSFFPDFKHPLWIPLPGITTVLSDK